MKYLILFISLSVNAQLQSDWNATEILEYMAVSWSVGNGCLESNYKVVNTNGLELNGNTLEVMDARIQVIGELTNFGEQIETTHELIILSCSTSEIVVYNDVLNVEDSALETIKIYPNPVKYTLNIRYKLLEDYIVYDIKGKKVLEGMNNNIDVSSLSNGLYFLMINKKQIFKFIKK